MKQNLSVKQIASKATSEIVDMLEKRSNEEFHIRGEVAVSIIQAIIERALEMATGISGEAIQNALSQAFPVPATQHSSFSPGLTKLEHFTGLAMQGMLANPELGRRGAHVTACEARQHSESLLQELQTQGEE